MTACIVGRAHMESGRRGSADIEDPIAPKDARRAGNLTMDGAAVANHAGIPEPPR